MALLKSEILDPMVKIKSFKTLEEGILLLQEEAKNKPVSIEEILRILSGKGRSLILILLCLPFCQPIQIPGFSMPFGMAIAFLGLRISFGKNVWLPKKLLSKKITPHTLQTITDKVLLVERKIKFLIHPRLHWICHSPVMEIMNGVIIFILGILLALPLPIPLSNLTAAWSIFLIALGMLEDDGVFVLTGYVVSLLTVAFFIILTLFFKNLFIT